MDLRIDALPSGLAGAATLATTAALLEALQHRVADVGTEGQAAQGLPPNSTADAEPTPATASMPPHTGLSAWAGTPNPVQAQAPSQAQSQTQTLALAPELQPAAGDSASLPWSSTAPSVFNELAAAPLLPVWVQGLQAPPLALHTWPQRPRNEPPEPTQRPTPTPQSQARDDGGGAEAFDDAEDHASPTAATEDDGLATPARRSHPPLPPLLQAELERRRAVLLWAPDRHGVQAWWLGSDRQGQPLRKRLAARGRGPQDAAWQWWWLKRGGDDGCAALPLARPAAGSTLPLALRVCSGTLPAPLAAAGQVWLDLTDAPRLWRDLGTQWTWLTAWSPRPLPWMR